MRFLKSFLVPVFKCEIPILFVPESVLLEISLSHQVQLRSRRQLRIARSFFSRVLANPIRLSFLGCTTALCARRVERRHTTHDKRSDCYHYKKPHRFEFPGHEIVVANHT